MRYGPILLPTLLDDDLSFTSGFGNIWPEHILVERAMSPQSRIVDVRQPSHVVVDDAREPMLSADGQSLAFVRDDHGRGRLMVRTGFESDAASEIALTPSSLNVYEASFLSEKEYAFSAAERGHPPQIYLTRCNRMRTLHSRWGNRAIRHSRPMGTGWPTAVLIMAHGTCGSVTRRRV